MYTLYVGNKNYSSWSLRGWFAMKLAGAPFREVPVRLVDGSRNPANRSFSPSGWVPALHDGSTVVWDSMAIAEYLAERHPGLWPADAATRAWARSIAAEMHSSFRALRDDMTMCVRERLDVRPWSSALATDVARVEEIWNEGRARHGRQGAFLCGPVSLADAFYAPVAFRFQTYRVRPAGAAGEYLSALLAHPFMREWERDALADPAVIDADEPRNLYRDKLAGRG
ncbi:MAG: glutathione S-transferase family protein [Burkholderiales bacterium]|jgi:glutathione S-transferase|nr:glutathione S-transferase family protein [Burkholderiales bacterium]